MSQTDFDIQYVADLARIELTPEEKDHFAGQLGEIIEYVEKLNQADVGEASPTSHPAPMANVMREDEPSPSLSNEEALQNAPAIANGLFLVPKIVDAC